MFKVLGPGLALAVAAGLYCWRHHEHRGVGDHLRNAGNELKDAVNDIAT